MTMQPPIKELGRLHRRLGIWRGTDRFRDSLTLHGEDETLHIGVVNGGWNEGGGMSITPHQARKVRNYIDAWLESLEAPAQPRFITIDKPGTGDVGLDLLREASRGARVERFDEIQLAILASSELGGGIWAILLYCPEDLEASVGPLEAGQLARVESEDGSALGMIMVVDGARVRLQLLHGERMSIVPQPRRFIRLSCVGFGPGKSEG